MSEQSSHEQGFRLNDPVPGPGSGCGGLIPPEPTHLDGDLSDSDPLTHLNLFEHSPPPGPDRTQPDDDSRATVTGDDPPPPPSPPRGRPRVDGYAIEGELGRGGMGVVYKARQVLLNRPCALKMILAGAHASGAVRRRFLAEAEAVARLRHDHVVQIHHIGEADGLPYFELEYLDGGSLASRLDGTPLPPRKAAGLVEPLARGMHAAHGLGIVHRDLKPSNILLTDDGRPKVADFGLAKVDHDGPCYTPSESILGTPGYMSPEQAAGATRDTGPPADIYSLGAILYELLTGRPPFRSATLAETLRQVCEAPPVPPRALNPAVPRDLDTICLKCLQKEPSRRYGTAGDLAGDLDRFLKGQPIKARPVDPATRAWLWARRNRSVAGLLAAVAALVAALALLAMISYIRIDRALRLSQATLVGQYASNGTRRVDDRDVAGALPWFAEAMRLDSGDPARESLHRLRLAALLRETPRVTQIWAHPDPVGAAVFSPDADRVLTFDGREARIWDVVSGEAVGRPMRHLGDLGEEAAEFEQRRVAAFSPDGSLVVTAAGPTAHIWDARTGEPQVESLEHKDAITWAEFSPDGSRLVTASFDRTARLWDVPSGKAIGEPLPHADVVNDAAFSPDGQILATAIGGNTLTLGEVRLWDVDDGSQIGDPLVHGDDVYRVHFSPDGRRLVTASYDKNARVWDVATGKVIATLEHEVAVRDARLHPDGRVVMTLAGNQVLLWDQELGKVVVPPLSHRGPIRRASFSPDGRRVVTVGDDRTAQVWDVATGTPVASPLRHNGPVHDAALAPGGRLLLTAGADRTARLWDLAVGRRPTLTLHHNGNLQHAAYSTDGGRVVTAGLDDAAMVWDTRTGKALAGPLRHKGTVVFAQFSPDGGRVVTASADRTARLWDARDGRPLTGPLSHDHPLTVAAFDPTGRVLATATDAGVVRLWDAADGRPLDRPTIRQRDAITRLSFSPDGRLLLTAGKEPAAHLWHAADGRPAGLPLRHDGPLEQARFSPDGRLVVTAAADGIARVWAIDHQGSPRLTLAHDGIVHDAAFSPDGTRVATASADTTARVWDAVTGRPLIPPLPHDEPVYRIRFDPSGLRVLTGSGGSQTGHFGSARVWDAATGDFLTLPLPHGDGVVVAAFRPDGRQVLTISGHDPSARLWVLPTTDLPADDLARLAAVFSGSRIDATGGLVAQPPDVLTRWFRELRATAPAAFTPGPVPLLAWHEVEAKRFEDQRQWAAALEHIDPLVAAEPGSWPLLTRRAKVLAHLGRLEEAARDYGAAFDQGAGEPMTGYDAALVVLAVGDSERYGRIMRALLDLPVGDDRHTIANMIAYTAVLGPGSPDPERVVALARLAVEREPAKDAFHNTLGAALARAGRGDEAVEALRRSMQMQGGDGSYADWFFLGLAEAVRGRPDAARGWLRRTLDQIDVSAGGDAANQGDRTHDLNQRLHERILAREARSLLRKIDGD